MRSNIRLGLVALAVGLAGCGGKADPTPSPTPAPTPTIAQTPTTQLTMTISIQRPGQPGRSHVFSLRCDPAVRKTSTFPEAEAVCERLLALSAADRATLWKRPSAKTKDSVPIAAPYEVNLVGIDGTTAIDLRYLPRGSGTIAAHYRRVREAMGAAEWDALLAAIT